MSHHLYVEINVISFVLLLIVFCKTGKNAGRAKEIKLFQATVLAAMVLAVGEVIWKMGESGMIPFSTTANAASNTVFMIFAGITPCLWFIFSEEKLGYWGKANSLLKLLVIAPVILLTILCIISLWTGWVFYIDDANQYQRGPLYLYQLLTSYLYMVIAVIHAFYCAVRTEDYTKRHEALILASFLIMPAIGGIIQALAFRVPTSVISIAISLLMVFISFQETRISRDPLTGLNNRRRADEYLSTSIRSAAKNKRMLYYIMDVDSFKQINDTYGHTEGDRALIFVADALRAVCGEHNTFVARIGGDEFCIILEASEQYEPGALIQSIKEQLVNIVQENQLPYKLALSVGYSEFMGEGLAAKAIVDKADTMLYQTKKRHHTRR